MNKLSKLTALLLALVLALGVPLAVFAESTEIETKTEYYEVADQILQKMIMAYETYGEYKSMAELIADEDFSAFLEGLPEDELKVLANYVNDMFWAACIPYTNVGPFMPAVDVTNQLETASTFSLMSRATTDEETVEGLYLDKTATGPDANGQYTITLEAYVTGQVTTSTVDTFTPVDVVLVLDTSGSMAYDVSSDETTVDYEDSRRYALQQGVNTFIDQVAEQSKNANHRISIVEYDRANYGVIAEWSFVDTQARVDALKVAVDTLDAEGGTRPGMGLDLAYDQLTDNYNAPQGSTERKKIVVLFTDGIPSKTSFQPDYAAEAIETAYLLKANPDTVTGGVGATLYSIAIFPGADPATTVSTWTDIYTGTDDIAICNAFLHAVSSNYPSARAAEGTVTVGTGRNPRTYDCVNITPGTGGNNGYYLTANSVESMKEIFSKISNNIQSSTTSSTLTETTVVKDVLSPYFELPTGFSADSVTVQTADYKGTKDANGNLEWDDPVLFDTGDDGISFGTDPDTGLDYVTVKNFSFNENYVADVDHVDPFITNDEVGDSNVFYGRKLIISFKVEPTDGFLGGDNVVTNDPSSGVYQPSTDENGNTTLEPIEKFPEPNVNVQVPPLKIVGEHQHIYLSNNADLDQLLQSFSVYYDIVDDNGAYVSGRYKVDSILNHYVALEFSLKIDTDNDGVGDKEIATYAIAKDAQKGQWTYDESVSDTLQLNFTEDTTFYISYKAIATEDTVDENGNTVKGNYSEGEMTASVYVYKPQVTFQDTRHEYLATVTADGYYNSNSYVAGSLKWYNTQLQQYSTEATVEDAETGEIVSAMLGTEPTRTFTYDPLSTTWITDGLVTSTACVPVNVTNVLIDGDTEITINSSTNANSGYLTTNRTVISCTDCNNKDGTTTPTNVANDTIFEFVVHIYNVHGKLAISKTVVNNSSTLYTVDENQEFTFTVTLTDTANAPVSGDFAYTLSDGTNGTLTFTNGTTNIQLLAGQTLTIEGITNGVAYTVTETTVVGFTPNKTSESGNIVANATQNVAFTNTYNVGQLKVTKTVDDQSGMGYDLSADQFSFTVTFSDTTNAIGYTIDDTSGTTTNGVATFTLTKDQTATFDRIPAGVTYTVTESDTLPVGYTKGTETNTSGTIVANQTSVATVQNIYNTGTLTISKTGMDAGEYAVFNATVVARGVTKTFQVVVPNGGSAVIKGLDLGSNYTVTEVGDWTWRYTSEVISGSASGEIPTAAGYKAEVTFNNTKNKTQWIDGNTYAENAFDDVQ